MGAGIGGFVPQGTGNRVLGGHFHSLQHFFSATSTTTTPWSSGHGDKKWLFPGSGRDHVYVAPPGTAENPLFVAVAELHVLWFVDVAEKRVLERVEMPADTLFPVPCGYESRRYPHHGLALTPDGGQLWIRVCWMTASTFYDVKPRRSSANSQPGCPNWLVFTPDGSFCV